MVGNLHIGCRPLRKGDVLEMRLMAPDDQPLATSRTHADSNKAVWFGHVGKRVGTADWPAGTYTDRVILHRGEVVVIDEERMISLR